MSTTPYSNCFALLFYWGIILTVKRANISKRANHSVQRGEFVHASIWTRARTQKPNRDTEHSQLPQEPSSPSSPPEVIITVSSVSIVQLSYCWKLAKWSTLFIKKTKHYVLFWKHIKIPSVFLMRCIPGLSPLWLLHFTCNWKSFVWVSYSLAVCLRSIFWTRSEINGLHPTIFQELNDYYLCCSIENKKKNTGVGTQGHPLEKERTHKWLVGAII